MSTADCLRIAAKVPDCRVLGPGNRAVIWVHGCCFDCPGCIARQFREGDYESVSPAALSQWYLGADADGLTISGGEPMLQAAGLAEMIRGIRDKRDCGVIVYSGFIYEALKQKAEEDPGIRAFLAEIDLLIDGPYIEAQNDNLPYRGSSNQRLLPLTARYRDAMESYYRGRSSREIEIRISDSHTLMIGVPGKEQAVIWNQIQRLGDKNGTTTTNHV